MTDSPAQSDSRRAAYAILIACTIGVGAVTFVLSFVGLRDYAERVAGYHSSLSWLVPVGVDGLTLCAVAATMILRHARWHVRLYAWAAFGIAVAASVAGNLSHAEAQQLSWQGRVGAGAWPVLLALSSHLVIVVRRNMERDRDATEYDAEPQAGPAWADAETPPPVATEPAAPVATDDDRPVRQEPAPRAARKATAKARGGRSNDLLRQRARRDYLNGDTDLTALAQRLKVSRRTVERYTDDLRQTATPNAAPPATDMGEARESSTDKEDAA